MSASSSSGQRKDACEACGDRDKSTLSNSAEAVPTSLRWTASVSFEARTITAVASYDVEIVDESVTSLQFDTRGLTIRSVLWKNAAVPINDWELSDPIPGKEHLGQCLSIPLPSPLPRNSTLSVEIAYTTSSDPTKCTAAQWLPPSQTAGKARPYLFTQCQAIHARSILPCMDCPAVKMTYEASVTVPSWATAVMSALPDETTDNTAEGSDTNTFRFRQPVPIPSYLFALAVGNIQSRALSPRVSVYSEPQLLEACAFEFTQTDSFLDIAESITDMPYRWTRYDLLCLPPSFPYGGMENPCLTFVTPTLLAGDRSLSDVVAHEIAHSWTGNLVTNHTWGHFWLNEGWTMWLQRKIMVQIHDTPSFFDFDAITGWKSLQDDVALLPKKATRLVLQLEDGDPDDTYCSVPYEKGFHLLWALERLVGSLPFLGFARQYLKHFSYGTVTSEQFKMFFIDYFAHHEEGINPTADFDWNEWLYGEGMPPCGMPDFDRTLAVDAERLAVEWFEYDRGGESAALPTMDGSQLTSQQKVCFLDALQSELERSGKSSLDVSTIVSMKNAYHFDQVKNAEILFRFCMIAVQGGDEDIIPVVVKFVTSQGRMKYVRPLYRALYALDKDLAVQTFLDHKDFYHSIAAKLIAADLGATKPAESPEDDDDDKEEEKEAKDIHLPNKGPHGLPLAVFPFGVAVFLLIGSMLLIRRRP